MGFSCLRTWSTKALKFSEANFSFYLNGYSICLFYVVITNRSNNLITLGFVDVININE